MGAPKSTAGTAGWLALSGGPVYAVWHEPETFVRPCRTAVLMVPPFGWDDIVSHRARRYWAIRLAEAGLPTLRFDLPGTAESSGDPHAPDLVPRWIAGVTEAAERVREETGAARLAVIGIGLGGLVAVAAQAAGAPIDDLLLWGVKGRGRTMVREIAAYAGVVASEFPADAAGPAPEDGIEVTGYLLANSTAEALSAIDVAKLSFPAAPGRRALLLSRDDLGIDPNLLATLEAAHQLVTVRTVDDYAALMTHPQAVDLRRPEASIAASIAWLLEAAADGGGRVPDRSWGTVPPLERTVELSWGEGRLAETVLNTTLGGEGATVVVSAPVDGDRRAPLGVVLLNSGSIRKTGPHRMWVELARRCATRGIVAARADFGPVGDSASVGDAGADERPIVMTEGLTDRSMIDRTQELIDQLRARSLVDQVIVIGHCSGAYLGFHVALTDDGVPGFLAINQQAFVYSSELFQERMFERIRTVARGGVVRRLREQGITATEIRQVTDALRHRYRRRREVSPEVRQYQDGLALLDRLAERGTQVSMLFSQEGELHETLFGPTFQAEVQARRWPNLELEQLPTQDHMARAIWLQRLTLDRLERALERLLDDAVTAAGAVSSNG